MFYAAGYCNVHIRQHIGLKFTILIIHQNPSHHSARYAIDDIRDKNGPPIISNTAYGRNINFYVLTEPNIPGNLLRHIPNHPHGRKISNLK